MEIKAIAGDITKFKADAVIVNLFEGVRWPGGATGAVDKALDGAISKLITAGEIKGKLNEVSILHTYGKIASDRVLVVGLGKADEFELDKVRQVSATAAKSLRKIGAKHIATIVHGAGIAGLDVEKAAQAVAEGTMLGLYTFQKYKTSESEFAEVELLSVVEKEETKLKQIKKGIEFGSIVAGAENFCRDLVNEPPNKLTPAALAKSAEEVAKKCNLEFKVFDKKEMEKLGMGALLAVAQGSANEPRLVVMRYWGAREKKKNDFQPALIGKGLTFDSGGISLKPTEKMEDMKADMSGAAAVISTIRAIAELKLKLNVTAIIPAVENLPSGTAYRPGDILRAMNGKTIEVVSTDAEGRLVLADAICYARQLNLSPIIDVATLTGSCAIALGPVCTGLFSNDQRLADKMIKAGLETGQKMWQLPLYPEYEELIKSDIADIKNSGGKVGGAITAAKFLEFFIEDTPWIHLDIASTYLEEKEQPYIPKGPTGVPVRALVNFLAGFVE